MKKVNDQLVLKCNVTNNLNLNVCIMEYSLVGDADGAEKDNKKADIENQSAQDKIKYVCFRSHDLPYFFQ